MAENVRAGRRVVQRQLLDLGEIDEDRQNAWLNAIDELEERKTADARDCLIPPPPPVPSCKTKSPVKISLDRMKVENICECGACWLGLHLWDLVGIDSFWTEKLPRSSRGTDWLAVFKVIVLYRLTGPGSEWKMHRDWYETMAVRDLLDRTLRLELPRHPLRLDKHVLRGGLHDGRVVGHPAPRLQPRQIFDKMKKLYMDDVKIPTMGGREIVMQRYGEPKDDAALVLS